MPPSCCVIFFTSHALFCCQQVWNGMGDLKGMQDTMYASPLGPQICPLIISLVTGDKQASPVPRDLLDALPSFKALDFAPFKSIFMLNPSSSYSKFNPGSLSPSPPLITPRRRTALLLLSAFLIALGAGAAIGYALHDSLVCTLTPNTVPRRPAPLSTFSASLVATGYAVDRWQRLFVNSA